MKVLQINALYGGGSTGRTTAELDAGLQARGIESIVAVPKSDVAQDNIFYIGNKIDWKLHGLCSRVFGKQGYFSSRATKKLLHFIDEQKPDIIHLRNLHGNYIHLPMLLQYIIAHQIPTVITLHDCWTFTGRCCHYTDDRCDKWKHGCGNCPALKKWNNSWFLDCSAQMLEDKKKYFSAINRLAVVGVSDWITNEARQSILGNAWRLQRIYNWIDLSVFAPVENNDLRRKLGLENRFVILGIAQKWSVEKGILVFLELAKSRPDDVLVLVGEIPSWFSLPSNVLSVGTISDVPTLAKYYDMADVFVNPSIQETFGKTTAEAISCGTPAIGYNVTATPELIGDNCGVVVDLQAQTEGILSALDTVKKNTKDGYSAHCVRFAQENFYKEKLIDDYVALYKEMIQ